VRARLTTLWHLIRRQEDQRVRKLRGLLDLLRPYRMRVILMLVCLLAGTAAGLAPPYLAGRAIDSGIKNHDVSALDVIAILFAASALINWGATYGQTYLVEWVGQRALQDLRLQIFTHLQKLSIGFYSRNKAGVVISRLTNDVEALDQLVTDGVVTLFSAGLTLIGTAAILLVLDVRLALITFCIFPVLFLGSLIFRIVSAEAYRLTREKIAYVTAYLQETLSGIRVVRAFSQEPRHLSQFAELNEENRSANMKTVYLNAAYFPTVEFLSAVATAVLLLYGGHQVVTGSDVTIGVLASFVFYLQSFFDPIQQLSQLYTTYQAGMAALDKVFELLDEEPDVVERPDAIDLPQVRGEIRFDDVWFAYGGPGGEYALRDIDLVVPPGQTVALVGETGAGKSTFAKLVSRFYDPTEGSILIDGYDLRDVSERSLRSQLGVVPQEGFLFSGTIRDNIAFGRTDATDSEVENAARAVGAHEFIERLPESYDTEVGERGGHLSAGQRQLVAFARAAVADPRILILDEATSNVDVQTEAKIEHGLRRLLAGRTAIVIAHRLSTIRGAGRIVVMEHGRIVEQGTHDELLELGGAYAALYQDWAEQATAQSG
jgi:ABC-type multidrug transport system fused ATPase/permease subunit